MNKSLETPALNAKRAPLALPMPLPAIGRVLRKTCLRPGFSLLELEVAMAVLGIALSGLYPLIVMQTRVVNAFDKRMASGTLHYLIPAGDAWSRKLGAAATIETTDPGAIAGSPTLTLDDEADGYYETGGGWNTETDARALNGEERWYPPSPVILAQGSQAGPALPVNLPTPSTAASWSFGGVAPGWYQVEVTWVEGPDRATNALYAAYDGNNLQGTWRLNQQIHPAGPVDAGGQSWQALGTMLVSSGAARVELSSQANGRVIADGACLVPLRNVVRVLSLTRGLTDQTATATVAVDVQTPQP
jgi:prepilin-type N-terminal cleavage/methylation domain-containing protein